jgi:hypothetical protein
MGVHPDPVSVTVPAVGSVDLRIDDFEDGVLPSVCVVTGEPTERFRRFDFAHTPGVVFLALLLGPFGILVVIALAASTRRVVGGRLPVSDEAVARGRAWRRRGWTLVVAGVAVLCLFAYMFDSFGGAGLLVIGGGAGVVLALAGLWLVARPPGSVAGRPDRAGRWVTISPASEAFADAYAAQEARRIAARRRAVAADDPAGLPG